MELVGGIFETEQDLTRALDQLSEKGFVAFKVFGADELYREPGTDEEMEASLKSPQHTASGTISGISVNPESDEPDDPSAESVTDDFMDLGWPEEIAAEFVSSLHQNRVVLLTRVKTGRLEEAQEAMRAADARAVHHAHPADSFPEDRWRQPRNE